MKKLGLKKETLAELSADDLRDVVGAGHGESHSCTPTYQCVSGDCEISNDCLNFTNGCTRLVPGGGGC